MKSVKPLTLCEAKDMLEKEAKKRELNFEQKAALQHATTFVKLTPDKTKKLVSELLKLENMTEPLAVKIADMMPEHADDVRVILAKERFALDQKVAESILGTVEKYL